MDTPRLMLRFKNPPDKDTIAEHNAIQKKEGIVLWGLWLKEFEEEQDIFRRLSDIKWPAAVYFADTTSKSSPRIYIAEVQEFVQKESATPDFVPAYYKANVGEIPFFFRVSSQFMALHAHQELEEIIGVPTVYFLDYENGRIKYEGPQRFFTLNTPSLNIRKHQWTADAP